MDLLKTIFQQRIQPWWRDLDSAARIMYVGMIAAGIAATVVIIFFIFNPSYETLYTGLDPAEAGEVIEKLKEDKISYRIENAGTTIAVPRSEIYDIRLKLASEGIPRTGNIGYEIFDKTNLGMTEFLQKVNYRRALEGELAKSLCGIRGVKSARVHIVIPETRLFREAQKDATASVVLALGGAGGISSQQVEGIIYLISASVEGLSPDNVTILDSGGRLLSARKFGDEVGSMTSSQLEIRKQVESYLENKAQSMVDPVVGNGKAIIRVSALLNFEQVEQTIENFDADNPSVRSEERVEESTTETPDPQTPGKTVSNKSENVVTNYEINRTIQHVVNSVGNIERLWVSILVDGTYKMVESGDAVEQQFQPRGQDDLNRIANIVKGAIGFDADRNDVIKIETAPFAQEEFDLSEPFFTNERIDEWLRLAGKLLMGLFAVMIFLKLRKWVMALIEEQRVMAKRRIAEREANRKREELLPRIRTEPQLADHIRNIAKEKPGEIARVVKTMMAEEIGTK